MPGWTSSASSEAGAGPASGRPGARAAGDFAASESAARTSTSRVPPTPSLAPPADAPAHAKGAAGSGTPAPGTPRHPGSAWAQRALLHPAAKPLVFALALLPLASLVWGIFAQTLGANPAETLIRSTGEWTLRLLLISLAVTPLRQLTGWHALARLRRMLGLFTFSYATLHFLAYAWLDMGLLPAAIVADVIQRPFILVGTLALLLMLPLAATSFNAAIRRLGAARWQALHRSVYAVGGLAILHFLWMRAGKSDYADVAVYGAILALLLGWRVVRWARGRR
jgi:methionine sulfoxide reductase heme-binding subunit